MIEPPDGAEIKIGVPGYNPCGFVVTTSTLERAAPSDVAAQELSAPVFPPGMWALSNIPPP